MNTYNKIWKNISRQLKYTKNSPQETDYQSAIYEIITDSDYLGWPSDRVKREYPVQMGSIKKSDIVLLDSDLSPLIAIEVKLSNSASNGIEQLGSYMDRCEPRLVFGITIKDSFNLFYDHWCLLKSVNKKSLNSVFIPVTRFSGLQTLSHFSNDYIGVGALKLGSPIFHECRTIYFQPDC